MNENLDLVEILKCCPKGTKLYSTVFGHVKLYLIRTGDYPIIIETKGGFLQYLSGNGILRKDMKDSECILFPSKEQRDWSKFKAPVEKFDYNTLKPFDKVLVRRTNYDNWKASHYSFMDNKVMMCDACWEQGIPYNDKTKHLAGTSDMPEEKYIWWED